MLQRCLCVCVLLSFAAGGVKAGPNGYRPLVKPKPTLSEQIQKQTNKQIISNIRSHYQRRWQARPGARGAPPRGLAWCADRKLADFVCSMVMRPVASLALSGGAQAQHRAGLLRFIASGPPNYCMAHDDPVAARAEAWGRYCNVGAAGRTAVLNWLQGRSARVKANKATAVRNARLARVAKAFRQLEIDRSNREKRMVGRRLRVSRDCDNGSVSACRELERTAFSPPALPEAVWVHAKAQQCRLGVAGKCEEAAKMLWKMRRWYDAIRLRDAGCLAGVYSACSLHGPYEAIKRMDPKSFDPAQTRKLLRHGCAGRDARSCAQLTTAIDSGSGGCTISPEETKTLADACKAGIETACRGTLRRIAVKRARPPNPRALQRERARWQPQASNQRALEKGCRAGNGTACELWADYAKRGSYSGMRSTALRLACVVAGRRCSEALQFNNGGVSVRKQILEAACTKHGLAVMCELRGRMNVGNAALRWYEAACRSARKADDIGRACFVLWDTWAEMKCPTAKRALSRFAGPALRGKCAEPWANNRKQRRNCAALRRFR